MASRKQLAAINFPPGERRRFVFPGPAETRTRHRLGRISGPPALSWERLQAASRGSKTVGTMQDAAPARIIGTNRNAGYVAVQNDNDCADVAVWTSLNVTADGVFGCD